MRRRRRRVKGTWFPNIGTAGPEGNQEDDDNGIYAELTPPIDGTSQIFVTELTFDHFVGEGATAEGTASRSLADFEGSEYLLRRIVGKCFLALDQLTGVTTGQCVQCTASFMVARESQIPGLTFPAPIGGESDLTMVQQYAPSGTSTVMNPWIWRRKWLLSNRADNAPGNNANATGNRMFPRCNAEYGSVSDGPHIDCKTLRRVHREDRLWFVLQVRCLGPNWADPFGSNDMVVAPHVKVHLDYRLFGMLRKARNTGTM